LQFSTEIAVYLLNVTRQVYGCYGTLVESHTVRVRSIRVSFDDLEWPWKVGCGGSKFSGGCP